MNIQVDANAIAEFCRRHQIRRLAFFGSVLRDDFKPDSDVDVLVEFAPEHCIGWAIVDVESELSLLVGGRKVDLVTYQGLSWRIKDRVLNQAQVVYAA